MRAIIATLIAMVVIGWAILAAAPSINAGVAAVIG